MYRLDLLWFAPVSLDAFDLTLSCCVLLRFAVCCFVLLCFVRVVMFVVWMFCFVSFVIWRVLCCAGLFVFRLWCVPCCMLVCVAVFCLLY